MPILTPMIKIQPNLKIHTSAHFDWHQAPSSNHPPHIQNEPDPELEADVMLADAEIKKPPKYAVVLYNDDYTTMDFVVMILQSEFRHSLDAAVEIMLNIHHHGKGTAGVYPKDIAETKARKVNSMARRAGYPLLAQIEPQES